MVKVHLEEVGKTVFVGMTPELSDDLAAYRQAVCGDHPETDLVRLPTSNGGEQIRRQCRECGHLLGGAKKREPGHENLPLPNSGLKSRYEAQRDRERHLIYQKHAKLQFEKSNSWFRNYSAYLESDEWREKRQLVFKRAGGMREGCGSATATPKFII